MFVAERDVCGVRGPRLLNFWSFQPQGQLTALQLDGAIDGQAQSRQARGFAGHSSVEISLGQKSIGTKPCMTKVCMD